MQSRRPTDRSRNLQSRFCQCPQVGKERGALRKALGAVDSKAVSWYRDGLVTGESVPALRARLLQDPEAPRGRSGTVRGGGGGGFNPKDWEFQWRVPSRGD